MHKDNQAKINSFLRHLKVELNLSDNTIKGYESDIEKFDEIYDKKFESIKKEELSFYTKHLSSNYKPTSQSRKISSLKKFYNYLELNYNIENIFQNTKNPKIGFRIPVYFSDEEIKRLLNSVDGNTQIDIRDRAMLELLYATGIRSSELLNLKTSNLKFADGFIQVLGKGNKERIIPITSRAINSVQKYLDIRIKFVKKQDNTLFLNSRGDKLSRQGFDKILKSRAKNIGIDNISAHKFRHSIASHLLQKGADLRMIQTFLGHENISTTEIYTHIDNMKIKEEYDKYLNIDF